MRLLCCIALLCWSFATYAHQASTAYLALGADAAAAALFEVAVADAHAVVPLDRDADGRISWAEVRSGREALQTYFAGRLRFSQDSGECSWRASDFRITSHFDRFYIAWPLRLDCAAPDRALTVSYRGLFEVDPTHRLIVSQVRGERVDSLLLSPAQSRARLSDASAWQNFFSYLRSGAWHILVGFDHLLFLLALLLPLVLAKKADGGERVASAGRVTRDALLLATSFTLAHSLTLAATVLGWLELPATLVEGVIAVSVILAALNLVLPLWRHYHLPVAFVFGLFHGCGFAGVLRADLAVGGASPGLPLVAFNLGIEIGQLLVVAALLPLFFWLRETRFYRYLLLPGSALGIGTLGSIWLIERIA